MRFENGKISAYPKIWALGTKYAQGIFDQEVEITEKLDGSQFAFMWDQEGKLYVRSKGTMIDQESVPDLFQKAVEHLQSITPEHFIRDVLFFGETICRPRHNTLTYTNIPKNTICLFDAYVFDFHQWAPREDLTSLANLLSVDVVPLLFRGKTNTEEAKALLGKESYYGNAIAEGVVIKAYKDVEVAGVVYPVHAVKVVTEQFKEKHTKNPDWKSAKSKTETLFEQYNSEARFKKAVQKLKESGQFTGEYSDIGKCMKILNQDLLEECAPDLKDELFDLHKKDFVKVASKGFPEWFKEQVSVEA